MFGQKQCFAIAASVAFVMGSAKTWADHIVVDSSDPEYTHAYQGASASTYASLGYSVGTGANDLKVHTNGTWTDPAGLVFGTIINNVNKPNDVVAWGVSDIRPDAYNYEVGPIVGGGANPKVNGNARDSYWVQNEGTNLGTNPTNDTPWLGNIFDLGGQANQAVVFPVVDHSPLPGEAAEYTVYLTNTPNSTSLSDWSLAKLDAVYLEGWRADSVDINDGFTTVWKLPSNATFRYVSVEAVGSQAIPGYVGDEDEIDAVAGLTAEGRSVVTPLPSSAWAGLALIVGVAAVRVRKTRQA